MKIGILNGGCVREKALVDTTIKKLRIGDVSIAHSIEEADTVIIITCGGVSTSIQESIDRVFYYYNYSKMHDVKVYVVGCLVKDQSHLFDDFKDNPNLKFIKEKEWYIEVANDINRYNESLTVEDKIKSRSFNIDGNSTAIQYMLEDGCNNKCTFCKYHYMDNTVLSMPYEEVLNYFRNMIRSGTKVLHLSGINVTLYGLDLYNEKVLHRLIHDISREEGLEMIFVDELVTKNMYDELLFELVNNPKVKGTRFQLETASDRLLKLMNRGYTLEEYDYYVKKLIKAGKNINTILMSGFPTETMDDVKETIDYMAKRGIYTSAVCEYTDFSYLPSSKLEQLPDKEKKEHTRFLIKGIKKINHDILSAKLNNPINLVYSQKVSDNHIFYTPVENIFAISDRKEYNSFKPGQIITGTPKKLTRNRKLNKTVYRI